MVLHQLGVVQIGALHIGLQAMGLDQLRQRLGVGLVAEHGAAAAQGHLDSRVAAVQFQPGLVFTGDAHTVADDEAIEDQALRGVTVAGKQTDRRAGRQAVAVAEREVSRGHVAIVEHQLRAGHAVGGALHGGGDQAVAVWQIKAVAGDANPQRAFAARLR